MSTEGQDTTITRGAGETGGHFLLHFCSSLVSLLSLGVNLLGHNGNSQDGRMKVLINLLFSSLFFLVFSKDFHSLTFITYGGLHFHLS